MCECNCNCVKEYIIAELTLKGSVIQEDVSVKLPENFNFKDLLDALLENEHLTEKNLVYIYNSLKKIKLPYGETHEFYLFQILEEDCGNYIDIY